MTADNPLTPELTSQAIAIVRERGIAPDDFTPAVMGDVLQEALRRLDALTCEVIEGRTHRAKEAMRYIAGTTYLDCVARAI